MLQRINTFPYPKCLLLIKDLTIFFNNYTTIDIAYILPIIKTTNDIAYNLSMIKTTNNIP